MNTSRMKTTGKTGNRMQTIHSWHC